MRDNSHRLEEPLCSKCSMEKLTLITKNTVSKHMSFEYERTYVQSIKEMFEVNV